VNVWFMLGLLRSGKPDLAYDTFKLIAPGYLTGLPDDPKQKVPPYVFANGYFGPDHRNNKFQMEFTWITGSVAWYYNVLIKEMIGIKPNFGSLDIKPNLPSDWAHITAHRVFRGKNFTIRIAKADNKKEGLYLNGQKLIGHSIPIQDTLAENSVEFFNR